MVTEYRANVGIDYDEDTGRLEEGDVFDGEEFDRKTLAWLIENGSVTEYNPADEWQRGSEDAPVTVDGKPAEESVLDEDRANVDEPDVPGAFPTFEDLDAELDVDDDWATGDET